MRESNQRARVVRILRGAHPISVENSVCPGTPDVAFIGGWVELKAVDAWPKREATPLRLPHYTAQQRVWHHNHQKAGGRVFVLVVVGRDWLLLDGMTAAKYLGHANKPQLGSLAVRCWWGKLDDAELKQCILNEKISPKRKSCSSLDAELD